MANRMLWKTDDRPSGPSGLTRVQEVYHGIDLGINANTAEDYLCDLCLKDGNYSTLFEVDLNLYCSVHGENVGYSIHKCRVPGYSDRYEAELQYRVQEETMTQEERQLVVAKASPLVPSKAEKRNLMKSYLEAGLVNRDDFGAFADMAAEFLAIVALVHGLNPMLKEVHAWPIKRKVNNVEKVVGIETSVGVYGYQRQADERARRGDDYAWGEIEILSKEDKLARSADKCPSCGGSGKFGASGQCYRCKGKGTFDIDDVIVVRRPIYLRRQAQMAKEFGIPINPVVGYGVYRPGDSIPEGRDAMWRAESRATKDAFKKAYALDFWLPSVHDLESVPTGEEAVIVGDDDGLNGDDTHIIEVEAVELPPEVEPDVSQTQQPPLVDVAQLGFGETIPKSQEGIDMQNDVWSRLADLGYPKGKPQVNLIQALYGDDVNWKNITGGQLHNMLTYASKSHNQPQEVKDALKEECRKHTEEGKFWL